VALGLQNGDVVFAAYRAPDHVAKFVLVELHLLSNVVFHREITGALGSASTRDDAPIVFEPREKILLSRV